MHRTGFASLVLGLAFALGWLAAPESAWGQRSDSGAMELEPIERLELDDAQAGVGEDRAIELHVRVMDAKGEPIEELTRVDLQILEDGRPVDPKRVTLQPLRKTERGVAVVLAIDVSRTMMGEPLAQAKAAAAAFLDKLGPNDRAAIVTFAGEVNVIAPFTASKADARLRLSTLDVDSGAMSTGVFDGIHRAVELLRQGTDLPRRGFVIVLSDGKDAGSQHSVEQVIQLAKGDDTHTRILVFTIGYASFGKSGLPNLEHVARETGATFSDATAGTSLSSIYERISGQIFNGYVARFTSDLDGKTHRVEVAAGKVKQARSLLYPIEEGPPFWWFASGGAAVVLGLGLATWLALRRRPAGRLVFVAGTRAGESISLRSGRIRIGSLPDNDVAIPSSTVSRYHAEVHVNGRRVSIEDLRSSNGTQVNGSPVQTSPLRPGDRIKIADVDLVFER